MAPSQRFANYPKAVEATDISYKVEKDNNPALRGLPLAIGAAIVTRSTAIQRLLYSNAGFSKLRSAEGLDKQRWRFDPTVIPLSDSDSNSPPTPPTFEEDLLTPQPADLEGRWSSFADYHALYKSGEVTPLQVVEALLPLINRDVANPTEHSKAWLDIHVDEVLASARASTARWAAGKPLGILDGVPFGVKADVDVKGYVNTLGMKPAKGYDYFGRPCARSLWPVEKLEEAGAVMVGKMNMHEIGMDTTGCNPCTGTPVNWYNREYYPGGSSSGAGSSLGAGVVPLCVGTDAGGSIRIPPAVAGQYSIKTSHARTADINSTMCIVGPMASNVADLKIAYRIMAQPDPEDPVTGIFAPSKIPDPNGGEKRYIGLCRPWINQSSPEVLEFFNKAVEHYTKTLGYEAVDIDLPLLREGQIAHGATCLAEAADHARDRVGPDSSTRGQHWLDLLSPANQVMAAVGSQTTANDLMKFGQVRGVIMSHLAHLFGRYGRGLLIASPMLPDVGYEVTAGDQAYGFTDGNRSLRSMMYAWLANTSGCPAATVPVGYAEAGSRGGGRLPVGMLAMGMWGEEERLLAWAAEGERYLRGPVEGWVDVIGLARGNKD
ncbi:Fatty acid amide hydrolase [Cytospora mali]|uniref:Fatty acid amide hydrolase n=1 Tax=Cytospora mali TaxID=578113 RepID=A0A194V3Z3_CYTMA|nr:Fatty acid amide hydrolase [Valsa mali var. pyri (nom. inval.)]